MARRVARNDGLRQLLIADWDRSMLRWRIPGRVYEFEERLKSGQAVELFSGQVMIAFFHAGLPCDEYCFGGRYLKARSCSTSRTGFSRVLGRLDVLNCMGAEHRSGTRQR
jgi:hypothetical protein